MGGDEHPRGVDASGWPVVVVALEGDVDEAGAAEVTAALEGLATRGERFGLVFDYQRARPEVAQAVSSWMARRMPLLERVVAAGVTVVAPDSVERVQDMITSGLFSLPFPSWATATVAEGEDWVRSLLGPATGGTAPPP